MTTCKQYREQLIELARSGAPAPTGHLDTCPQCRSFFETQVALQSALAAIAGEPVLPEWRGAPTPARRTSLVLAWLLPTAAVVIAGALLLLPRSPAPQARTFYQIPYTAPLAPYERARIVRMDVPVTALIAAGFEIHYTDTAALVPAEVLFGQDGRAHAIRPIPKSDRRTD